MISAVIPSYQAESHLEACIQALRGGSVQPDEIVVIDDASADGSYALADELGVTAYRLIQRGGSAQARNLGASVSRGDFVFFVDADVEVHADALERGITAFEAHPGLAAVIGCYDDSPTAPGLVSQYRNLLNHFTHQTAARESTTFWSACGVIRREAFLELGGFDNSFGHPSIEDIELGWRLRASGQRVRLDPGMLAKHRKRWTLGSMLKVDLFRRAIPWTRLILSARSLPNDLNLKWNQRASVAAVWLSAALGLFALATPALLVPATLGLGLHVALNMPFLRLLAARHGPSFACRAWPLHLLFHLNCGLGFLLGATAHLSGGLRHFFPNAASRGARAETSRHDLVTGDVEAFMRRDCPAGQIK